MCIRDRLLKDDKLISDQMNNPVNDCEKAKALLLDEIARWHSLQDATTIPRSTKNNAAPMFSFVYFFKIIATISVPPPDAPIRRSRRLRRRIQDKGNMVLSFGYAGRIQTFLKNQTDEGRAYSAYSGTVSYTHLDVYKRQSWWLLAYCN